MIKKIIIEEFIKCREIECAVLGNSDPKASAVGEIIPHREFYDYEAKYLDQNGADLKIPADLSEEKMQEVRELALKTFRTLCLEGMARVDMFLADNGEIYVNEVNSIPGFTNISMYPKLWEYSGMSYSELIDTLINFAIERYNREQQIKSTI